MEGHVRYLVFTSLLLGSMLSAPLGLAAGSKETFDLKGEVYPVAFKIEMKNEANRKLVSVKAGTYRIKIEDPSTIHNFRLRGPSLNRATTVAGKSESVWTVRLKKGTYRFLCDPHAATMKGTFRVT
jgi:plastocyanin